MHHRLIKDQGRGDRRQWLNARGPPGVSSSLWRSNIKPSWHPSQQTEAQSKHLCFLCLLRCQNRRKWNVEI